MDSKDLRIGVVADEGQLTKFENAIRRATIEVSKLADQLNRASKTFAGFLGGARMTGGGQGTQFRPGNNFARAPLTGAGGGIGQPVQTIANAISASAKGSTDALRSMESTTRTTSSKMASDINILDNALAKLEKRYSKIKAISGGGGGIPGIAAPAAGGFVPEGFKVINKGGIDTVVPSNYKPSIGERMAAFFQNGKSSGDGGIMQTIQKAIPYYIMAKGGQAIFRELAAQPDDFNRQAQPLSRFADRGLAMMYGGDFHSLYNMERIAQGPQGGLLQAEHRVTSAAVSDATRRAQRELAYNKAHGYVYTPQQEQAYISQKTRMFTQHAMDKLENTNVDEMRKSDFRGASGLVRYGKTILDSIIGLDPQILRNLEGVDTAEKLRKDAQLDVVNDIYKASRENRAFRTFEQGWQGAVDISRALQTSDPFMLQAKLFKRGYNTGQLGSAQSAIAQTGGFRTGLKYRDLGMRSSVAGHVDLNALIGATAQAGGPDPGEVAALVHGLKIDPQAKSVLANAMAHETLNGDAMVNPSGMLAAFAPFNGAGTTAGEQMRIANAQVSGMGAINQNMFKGGVDQLQQGRNWLNAINVAGGNLGGQNYLVNSMNFKILARLRQNPNVQIPELQAVGLSNKQVLDYGERTMGSMFRNVMLSGSNPMTKMAQEMMSGGFGSDFGAYVKANRGKQGFDVNKAIYTMAQILKFEGFAKGDQQAYGMANDLAGIGNMGPLRRGGPGDAAAGTAAAKAYHEVGTKKEEDAKTIKKVVTDDYIKKSVEWGEKYGELGENLGMSAAAVGESMINFADQLDILTNKLKVVNSRVK